MPVKKTLTSLLLQLQDSSHGIFFTSNANDDVFLSYGDILKTARGLLHNLLEKGIKQGDELIFQFNSNINFVATFWACQLGGIVPVPVSVSRSEEVKQKLTSIWKTLRNPWIISDWTDNTTTVVLNDSVYLNEMNDFFSQRYLCFNKISKNLDKLADVKESDENTIALIQFSSGSTGTPKGVVLTHKSLFVNLHAIHKALTPFTHSDFMCSWTPLTHDLGIIGGHIMPIYAQISQNLISTNHYLKDPSVWLQKISLYKATFSACPNFGLHYSTKHINSKILHQLDLSSIRSILNGAEPISYDVCREFIKTFSSYQLAENSILPVYGMAEACLAVTIPKLNNPLKVYHLKRSSLRPGDEIKTTDDITEATFVSVSKSVEGSLIKLVHEDKDINQDKIIGEIVIKGENVTKTYYGHRVNAVDENGWFHTGDLGFLDNNELVVTGRKKDILFSNGQNFYPQDLERIAEQVEEIETTKTVFAGCTNFNTGSEEVLCFLIHKRDVNSFIPLAEKIKLQVSEKVGIAIKHIIPVKKIPKTTSGKVQRYLLIENYQNGIYDDVMRQIENIQRFSREQCIIGGRNHIETNLIAIWQEILETTPISINDNFFELGGDSVKAIRIGAKMQELNYPFQPALFLEKKTIRQISEYILESSSITPDTRKTIERNLQNEQREYSITHFSNDDLEDIFSKK